MPGTESPGLTKGEYVDPLRGGNLAGRVALVTNTADEIGFEIARFLVHVGAIVHVVNPDHRSCLRQVSELRKFGAAVAHCVNLEVEQSASFFSEIFAEEVPKLHLVVSNARLPIRFCEDLSLQKSPVSTCGELQFLLSLRRLMFNSSDTDFQRILIVGNFHQMGPRAGRQSDCEVLVGDPLKECFLKLRASFGMMQLRDLVSDSQKAFSDRLTDALWQVLISDLEGAYRTDTLVS